ncbi:MAG: trypsin-like peptidase domain-containing protein [Thermodesulfobacteriota bacterium]|nr:trypsin-like peptidase domain-containing protein [Thermodesulfobacteriota bacterium]
MQNKNIPKKYLLIIGLALIYTLLLSRTGAALTEDEKNNVSVYNQVAPSVVNVSSVVMELDFFLNPVPKQGSGSGIILDSRGYILTNHHVITEAQSIHVTLSDGGSYPAKLVGSDPDSDLAVIKIDAPGDKLKPVRLGDSDQLQVGQKVLAIGNPFGLNETLTTGIISSIGRSIRAPSGLLIEDMIQTDASINPGNSGGPLLNSRGELIGINTAIFSPSGGSVGIGFAIPVNTARKVFPQLMARGYVEYPWLGAGLQTLRPSLAEALKLPVRYGVMLAEVVKDGPADRAGLRGAARQVRLGNTIVAIGGDIILQIDGKKVESGDVLIRYLREKKPGDRVLLTVLRGSKTINVPLTLGKRPRRG